MLDETRKRRRTLPGQPTTGLPGMSRGHDDEPILVRSNWGTSRYVYNPRHPVGAGLIIGSLLFAGLFLCSLRARGSWSEDELRDAVHVAVRDLEATPQTLTRGPAMTTA
ncbi:MULTISPECIES: hypothetical protein [unclassified Streptomyces]|uniref:hypothetical protein n=1 Tax=unclassified Streptomyces TaxID=2593676 RepID=UPI0033FA0151